MAAVVLNYRSKMVKIATFDQFVYESTDLLRL